MFASLIVVAAVPVQVGAASGTLVVASQHTTDTDFGEGVIDNGSIEGTGTSASVLFDSGPNKTIDDFEDGDVNIETAGWSGWTGDLSADSTAINGSYSGALTPSGGNNDATADAGSNVTRSIQFKVNISKDSGSVSDETVITISDQDKPYTGNEIVSIEFEDGDNDVFVYSDTSASLFDGSVATWSPDTVYTVEMLFFDNGNIRVELNGDTIAEGTASTSETDWRYFHFQSSTAATGVSRSARIDDVKRVDTDTSGTYTSTSHNASQIKKGFANLSTTDANYTIDWQYYNGSSWVTANTTTGTQSGNITTDVSTDADKWRVNLTYSPDGLDDQSELLLHDEGVLFENDAAVVDNASATPSGGEKLTTKGVTLSIDVNDSQFGTAQGESLSVEFQQKAPGDSSFSTVTTNTLNSNGTSSTTLSGLVGGTHEWRVIVTDDYGAQTTSQTFTFNVPDTLYIRNVTSLNLITGSDVTVTFYDGGVVERTTSNGEVDLTGLPVETTMVVNIEHPDYHDRTLIITNIYEQQTAYLLNNTEASVEVRFELEDRTGLFEGNNPRLFIQRPINSSGTLDWKTVVADEFGVAGVTTDLQESQRYRLILENDQGDKRVLGTYTADVSETVTLTIGSIEPDGLADNQEWGYNASYINSSSGNYVKFSFNDTADATDTIWIEIHEFGNESNVLLANQSFAGPFGRFTLTEQVPSDQLGKTWAIDVTLDRGDQITQFTAIAGPNAPIMPAFPAWLMALISVGSLWIVGGLFSQLNGDIGGLVIAGMGATYWYLDFLPEEIGQGVVALALIMAGIIFINERRGEA